MRVYHPKLMVNLLMVNTFLFCFIALFIHSFDSLFCFDFDGTDSDHFEDFFEEISDELMKFGELEQLQVVENLGEHMIGNVYVKYRKEEEAEACLKALMGRFYGGRMLTTEYSPVTDFNEGIPTPCAVIVCCSFSCYAASFCVCNSSLSSIR
jgi:hypothetical protein